MPLFATAILGIASQAAWKLASYLFERITGPSAPSSAPASAGASAGGFQRSLAEATSAQAVRAGRVSPARAVLPQDPAKLPDTTMASFGGGSLASANVADLYRRIAEIQAP
jgi:hypothetical protein